MLSRATEHCLKILVCMCVVCVSQSVSAQFYHTVVGTPSDDLLPGRQDRPTQSLNLADGSVLIAGVFNGNHSDVVCSGRSFANLTRLDQQGAQIWSRTYANLPADSAFVVPHRDGFHLYLTHRYCHINRTPAELEIWQVSKTGKMGDRLLLLANTSILFLEVLEEGQAVAVIDKQGHPYLSLFDDAKQVTELELSAAAKVLDLSRTHAGYAVLLRQRKETAVVLIDEQTHALTQQTTTSSATHLAGNENSDELFLIHSPRYRHPELKVERVSSTEIDLRYTDRHQIDVSDATLSTSGELWLAGENQDFATLLTLNRSSEQNFQVRQRFNFRSVFPNTVIRYLNVQGSRVFLSGSTYISGRFGSSDEDVFALSVDLADPVEASYFSQWTRCSVDVAYVQQLASQMKRKLYLEPQLRLRPVLRTAQPISYVRGEPVTAPDCPDAPFEAPIALLEALASKEVPESVPDLAGFSVRLNFVAPDHTPQVIADETSGVIFSYGANTAEDIWDYLVAQIYPHVGDYLHSKETLRRETGILPNFEYVEQLNLADVTDVYSHLLRDWQNASDTTQRALNTLGGYLTIYFTDQKQFSLVMGERFSLAMAHNSSTAYVPFTDIDGLMEVLATRSEMVATFTSLEEAFWTRARKRIVMHESVNHQTYERSLIQLLELPEGVLESLSSRLGPYPSRVLITGSSPRPGSSSITGQIVVESGRLYLPATHVEQLAQFLKDYQTPSTDETTDQWIHRSAEGFLGIAINYNWPNLFLAALKAGADVHNPCYNGTSPAHQAAEQGRTALLLQLLDLGSDINGRTANGDTPLHLAIEKRRIRTIEILLGRGASPSLVNHNNETVLDVAHRRLHSTPEWVIGAIAAAGGKRGSGVQASDFIIPSHGC